MALQQYRLSNLTERIIRCFYKVYNELGFGFLEKVYERAMAIEIRRAGMQVRTQVPINVYYGGESVGSYFADLLVDDAVIVELKAAECIAEEHEAQLLNYLKATKIEIGLLFNFGIRPAIKRKIYSNK